MMNIKRFTFLRTDGRNTGPPGQRSSRSGFTLVEMIVAGVLLTVVMSVSMQMLVSYAKQQRMADRRQLAMAELANLTERITARSFADVTTEKLQSLTIGDATRDRLPESELLIEVDAQDGSPQGKRIRLEIRWRNANGQTSAPVRLTSWLFAHTEEKP